MWYEGKITIKTSKIKHSYDIGAANQYLLYKIITNTINEINKENILLLKVKIKGFF